LKKEPKQ